jgi:hypothetical protein
MAEHLFPSHTAGFLGCTVPKFIESVSAKTSPKRSFSMIENAKTSCLFSSPSLKTFSGWRVQAYLIKMLSKGRDVEQRTSRFLEKNTCIFILISYRVG